MADQLEQDVRRAVENFVADVEKAAQRAVLRALRSIFDTTPSHPGDVAENVGDHMRPPNRSARRRTLTAEQWIAMRAQLATCIRERLGQSTLELARAVGIPSGRLRPQLRQLADAGAIRIERHFLGGLWRYTYFSAGSLHDSRVDASTAVTGVSRAWA